MVGGRRLTFGFHGIWQGTAVLYDHQTDSLWMHLTGECFAGPLQGTVLTRLASGRHTTWEDWRALHPDTDVLAREARWLQASGERGYFTREGARSGSPYLPRSFRPTLQTRDARLPLHALVYGVRVGATARAYPLERLRRAPPVEETLEDVPVTVWFDGRARSAAAFDRRSDGVTLSFTAAEGGRWRDRQGGSLWTLDGLCVAGPRAGQRLAPLDGLLSEWYGWVAHHPGTTLWGP